MGLLKAPGAPRGWGRSLHSLRLAACALAAVGVLVAAAAGRVRAEEEPPSGEEIARRINARDEGEASSRRVTMQLIDKRGGERVRETRFYRRFFGDEKRTAIFYLSPTTVKDTAFLTYDYADPERADDQWLYLPALRKVRRISASDRGDSFLGTDLSYEDIKKETRVSLEDYTWKRVGEESVDGHPCHVVESVPVDEETARELGYGRVVSWVDGEIWLVRKADYFDRAGRPLKTTHVRDVRRVDGIWTPHRIEVENHKTGHRTVFVVDEVDYAGGVDESVFTERALRRGAP